MQIYNVKMMHMLPYEIMKFCELLNFNVNVCSLNPTPNCFYTLDSCFALFILLEYFHISCCISCIMYTYNENNIYLFYKLDVMTLCILCNMSYLCFTLCTLECIMCIIIIFFVFYIECVIHNVHNV